MSDAPIDVYRRFFHGEPGVCLETGEDGAHAFADRHEIECSPGSRHDTERFVWLTPERGLIGYRSDRWIDQALQERRIGLHACDQSSIDVSDPEIMRAAFLMGAERMASVLALPHDTNGFVTSCDLDGFSPHLQFSLERWMEERSVPLRQVVERMLHSADRADEPEVSGRLAMLVQTAVDTVRDGSTMMRNSTESDAELSDAAERWISSRMQDRQRRLEAELNEPRLAMELAAAVEALANSGDEGDLEKAL